MHLPSEPSMVIFNNQWYNQLPSNQLPNKPSSHCATVHYKNGRKCPRAVASSQQPSPSFKERLVYALSARRPMPPLRRRRPAVAVAGAWLILVQPSTVAAASCRILLDWGAMTSWKVESWYATWRFPPSRTTWSLVASHCHHIAPAMQDNPSNLECQQQALQYGQRQQCSNSSLVWYE